MRNPRCWAMAAGVAVLVSCGSSHSGSPATTSTLTATTTIASANSTTSTTRAVTTTGVTTTTRPIARVQPAIWPAVNAAFATPEDAAADFVTHVLNVPAVLGTFQQGDSRSGEIQVFSPGEGYGANPVPRGYLALRQLGPASTWFVIAAINENMSIASPETAAPVPAAALTVTGRARGFESSVTVTAFIAGDTSKVLDTKIVQAGNQTPEPFSVTLDLSHATPGDVVTLLIRGASGLANDPGEFGAIPVVIVRGS